MKAIIKNMELRLNEIVIIFKIYYIKKYIMDIFNLFWKKKNNNQNVRKIYTKEENKITSTTTQFLVPSLVQFLMEKKSCI